MSLDDYITRVPETEQEPVADDDPGCLFCQARDDEPHQEVCPMYVPACLICGSEQIDPEAVDGPLCHQCRVNCAMDTGEAA